ncbi:unnamed protein product [Gongylonema pulchrum]|uniref:Glutaredoxin domain-containing protein n=1 Tax=Gongylonema pulchrum TaxID=637853 RepID=A0A183E3A3_9BILA|nr:unnamed protein product [Gongylonema pulchrum]
MGKPVVHEGEVFSGGEVIRDGRQTGFDLISNIKQLRDGDGAESVVQNTLFSKLSNHL